MTKRVLFISNLFPNPLNPSMASFNWQQIVALRVQCEIDVIAPIPWTALVRQRFVETPHKEIGINIYHPVYYYPPGCMRSLYGQFYYWSIKSIVRELFAKHSYDLVYASWLYPDAWAAAQLAKEYDVPLFVKVHGTDVNRLTTGTPICLKSLNIVKLAQKVICVSRALKGKLVSLGAAPEDLEVLYNGVDRNIFHQMNREEVQQQLGVASGDFLVLYVGNLLKEKGLEELLTAFKLVMNKGGKPSRLVIIGAGKYGEKARQLAASLDISASVQFLGSQSLETIALWMNAASVLCLPSYMEGVPNVVLEALSCGTRVVATNVGGIPELDKHDGMLTLVPPREVAPLADALLSVQANPLTPPGESSIISWQENAERLYRIFQGT